MLDDIPRMLLPADVFGCFFRGVSSRRAAADDRKILRRTKGGISQPFTTLGEVYKNIEDPDLQSAQIWQVKERRRAE